MTDGWDLYAVVRGCTPGTAPTPFVDQHHDVEAEDPFPNFSSSAPLTFQNDDDTTPFSYPDDGNDTANNPQIEGLEEIYKQMHVQPQLFSDIPDFQGFENQQQIHQPELNNSLAPPSSFLSTLPITNSQSNPVRARRRKNQQMKMVHQMTQEQLSGDSWAWRKYGQKPIKGSPYPRNYYRCSTSKGCAARRQVEISPIDSSVFIVSYTGEHTHPRPTHRSSLAGSTRNKLSAAAAAVNYQKSMSGDSSSSVPNFVESKPPSCTSTSPASASSFSPPLMEGENHEAAHDNTIQLINDIDDDDDDDQEVLIPNTVMNEEIFKGFQGLSEGSGFF